MFEIEFYSLPNGEKPVEEFLNSLDIKMRTKSLYGLTILEEYGNQLREPYSKSLGDGLFELRIKFASDITRISFPKQLVGIRQLAIIRPPANSSLEEHCDILGSVRQSLSNIKSQQLR